MKSLLPLVFVLGCGAEPDKEISSPIQAQASRGGLYYIQVENEPHPPVAGATHMALNIWDVEQVHIIEDADVVVTPWMSDHGHGVSDEPEVVEDVAGEYAVSFAFSMPGPWDVTFLIDGNLGSDEVVFSYEVE